MNMKRKPVIGETLYSLNVGHAARGRHQPQVLTPVVVTEVGRKYFTVGEGYGKDQFRLDDWRQKTEYSPTAVLYETPGEWEDELEAGQICVEIWKVFEYGRNSRKLPLDVLRKISGLVGQEAHDQR
jgi:hypothetical protein